MPNDLLNQFTDALGRCSDIESLTADDVLILLNYSERLSHLARELKTRAEDVAIGFIKAKGEIVSGDIRYYVGVEKKTKCLDHKATLGAILEVSGGDLDLVTQCLSTSCWKPAETKKQLGERAGEFFRDSMEDELREGKPTKLQKMNTAFLPRKN